MVHGRGSGSLVRRRGGRFFFCFYRPGEIVSVGTAPPRREVDGFVETPELVAKADRIRRERKLPCLSLSREGLTWRGAFSRAG